MDQLGNRVRVLRSRMPQNYVHSFNIIIVELPCSIIRCAIKAAHRLGCLEVAVFRYVYAGPVVSRFSPPLSLHKKTLCWALIAWLGAKQYRQ